MYICFKLKTHTFTICRKGCSLNGITNVSSPSIQQLILDNLCPTWNIMKFSQDCHDTMTPISRSCSWSQHCHDTYPLKPPLKYWTQIVRLRHAIATCHDSMALWHQLWSHRPLGYPGFWFSEFSSGRVGSSGKLLVPYPVGDDIGTNLEERI